MLASLRHVLRYRALIASLVSRDLKARYRGSILGFFWSFVNPLLLLLIYTFVFTVVMPGARGAGVEPFALFLFCGILPWSWFSSSLLEASNVLVAGGNLIKKVLFPAEVLPLVTVVAGLVHFCFGLVILAGFLLYYRLPIQSDVALLPVVMFVQLTFTTGLALLASSLTVHFRDVRDLLSNLLTLWFFATPIIYPLDQAPASIQRFLNLNPLTHVVVMYQEILFHEGPFTEWWRLIVAAVIAGAVFLSAYLVFDRLRDSLPEEV